MSPLRGITSIKLKFGLVIVAAVGVAALVSQFGYRSGWPVWPRPLIAAAISLLMVHFLAKGMTSPLRDMEAAVSRMAKGDYHHRIESASVDEVGRLAVAFNTMSGELAKIEQERRDLVTNVSHELRTPLAALRAQLENMIDGVTKPTAEQLDVTLNQSLRLEALISRLMDLARLESGQTSLRLANVSLLALLETAAAEAAVRSPACEFSVTCPLDLKAEVDEHLMLQVFANLLDNAARHHKGDTPVEIEATPGNPAKVDVAKIEIRDRGEGLSTEQTDRVFDRFYRADADRSPSSGGAGLGLTIARGIVELHGGLIRAEANHPQGLRVIVEL